MVTAGEGTVYNSLQMPHTITLSMCIMISYSFIILLVACLQVISSQDDKTIEQMPEKCRRPPNIERPHRCCKPPPVFPEEDMAECGIEKPKENERFDASDCSKQQCLMKKHNLMTDGKLNINAMKDLMNTYATKNEDMKPVIEEAKACIKEDLPGPPHICLPNKIMFCIGMIVTQNCPAKYWDQSDDCKVLKEHMEECKPFFERHHNKLTKVAE